DSPKAIGQGYGPQATDSFVYGLPGAPAFRAGRRSETAVVQRTPDLPRHPKPAIIAQQTKRADANGEHPPGLGSFLKPARTETTGPDFASSPRGSRRCD